MPFGPEAKQLKAKVENDVIGIGDQPHGNARTDLHPASNASSYLQSS